MTSQALRESKTRAMALRTAAARLGAVGSHPASQGLGGAALVWLGLRRRSLGGVLLAAGGAALAYHGVTGRWPLIRRLSSRLAARAELAKGITIQRSITIGCEPDAVYAFWRELENLPMFMVHLISVQQVDSLHSHWVAREGGMTLEWDAEITEDMPGQRIAWRSLPGGDVQAEGTVVFRRAPGNRGTELRLHLCFVPPGGILTLPLAPFLSRLTRVHVSSELHRLKQLLETGEIATSALRPGESDAAGKIELANARMALRTQGARTLGSTQTAQTTQTAQVTGSGASAQTGGLAQARTQERRS